MSLYSNTVGMVLNGVNGTVDTIKNLGKGSTSGVFSPPKAPVGGKTDVKKDATNVVDKVKEKVSDIKATTTPFVFFGVIAFVVYMLSSKK